MSDIGMKIVSALIAGIMATGMLAACGEAKRSRQSETDEPAFSQPDSQPQDIGNTPKSELPDEAEPTGTDAAVTEAPQEETKQSQTYETAEWQKIVHSEKIVDTAIAQLGVPFKSGGDDPEEGFDSSGLTYYCVTSAGIDFPRNVKDQLDAGVPIEYDNLAAGDLVYFSYEEGGDAKFCGVYIGGGLIIYSPVPDDFVKTANITTNYWVTHFVTGLRVTAEE